MKIIRNIAAVLIALSLFAGWSPGSGQRLAEASEIAQHSCDHSACHAQIAILEAELEEARQSCSLVLQVELEIVPGLLGDWAQLSFHSVPIEISAEAAENFSIGQDLSDSADSEDSFLDHILDCRIIVADIAPNV